MSYIVFCTFDLKGATAQNYKDAYADLAKLGLNRVMVSKTSKTEHVIPTTSAMGSFTGKDAASVATDIRDRVKAAFAARKFKSEIFIVSGGDNWAWIPATT